MFWKNMKVSWRGMTYIKGMQFTKVQINDIELMFYGSICIM